MSDFDPAASPVDVVLMQLRGVGSPQPTPGIARVTGADMKFRWDVQAGAGTTGAPQIYHGADLIEFTITLDLWLPEHFAAWAAFRPLVQIPPKTRMPKPLQVAHPWLTMQGISQAVVLECGQPETDEYMLTRIMIKMRQYRQTLRALAKPTADQAAPLDPYDQQIKDAREQNERETAAVNRAAQAALLAK